MTGNVQAVPDRLIIDYGENDNGYEEAKKAYNNHAARCQKIAEDVNKWGKNPHRTP
jgi:hypothetical protein